MPISNVCVAIHNREQEKYFEKYCRSKGIAVLKKDETAYAGTGLFKKAIYPIYYGLLFTVEKEWISWYSVNKRTIQREGILIIDINTFLDIHNRRE